MKRIAKQDTEPPMFKRWRSKGGWDASGDRKSKTFNIQAHELKQEIKKLLLKEQGYICCYCEERIGIEEKNSHIEHVLPKGNPDFAHLKSDYTNLLCSCCSGNSCGTVKKSVIIKVTPLTENGGEVFDFTSDGEIQGDNQDARDTISTLNLNSERLKAARNGIITVFLDRDDFTEISSLSEYDDWVRDYLKPDEKDHLKRFWSTVKWCAKENRCYFE